MASARLAPSWMRAATFDQMRPIRVRDGCSATMFSAAEQGDPAAEHDRLSAAG